MKLPSLNYLLQHAKNSFLHYPLTIISSLLATVLAIILIEYERDISNKFPIINALLCASMGIPMYFCTVNIANKKTFSKRAKIAATIGATLLLLLIYLTLPNADTTHNTSLPYVKFAIYNITCHLLVSFVPFIFSPQVNAFWHYNKILFLRFLSALLYSSFLYVGLILALTALRLLFEIQIHSKLYFDIWVVMAGFFNTWFFVAGIPKEYDTLETNYDYPKALRIFSQYVLLPLLTLYLIILYAYAGKILISWDWPKGIVSNLIICVSVLGILSFLLLYPYAKQLEYAWIKRVSKGYYFALIPLLIVLFIAIFMRLNDYGITINRYVILTFGLWLSAVCIYTVLGKTNIKFIPASLATVAMLVSFGPWGMFSVSERSQVSRLKEILTNSKILVEEQVQGETIWYVDSLGRLKESTELKNEELLSDSLHNELMSILEYLDNHHGFSSIKPWFKQNMDSLLNSCMTRTTSSNLWGSNYEAQIYMNSLGLKYEHRSTNHTENYVEFKTPSTSEIMQVSGFDYLVNFEKLSWNNEEESFCTFQLDSNEYTLETTKNSQLSLIAKGIKRYKLINLNSLIQQLREEYGCVSNSSVIPTMMQITDSMGCYSLKFEFKSIEFEPKKESQVLKGLKGNLFIKKIE